MVRTIFLDFGHTTYLVMLTYWFRTLGNISHCQNEQGFFRSEQTKKGLPSFPLVLSFTTRILANLWWLISVMHRQVDDNRLLGRRLQLLRRCRDLSVGKRIDSSVCFHNTKIDHSSLLWPVQVYRVDIPLQQYSILAKKVIMLPTNVPILH